MPDKSATIYLFILTANEEQRQAQALSSMIEESCQPLAKVVALVHYQSFVTNHSIKDNAFVRMVLNCPVIYLSGNMVLPEQQSQKLLFTERLEDSKWHHWQNQGRDFLNGANYYIKEGSINAALFSLHQSAECLLTAIIKAVLGYRVSSHNLSILLRLTQMFTADLSQVFNLNDDASMHIFEMLKHAYVNVRYKDTFLVDKQSVITLAAIITNLEEKVSQVYQSYLLRNTL